MTGTTNVVKIFGSTYGDYGIQPDGDDHSPFAGAPCVDKWDLYDGDEGPASLCAKCPVLELCRERARETDAKYGFHGFWAGLTAAERAREDEPETPVSRAIHTLHSEELSDREISERLGLPLSTVGDRRRRMGLRPNGDARGGARGRSQIERER